MLPFREVSNLFTVDRTKERRNWNSNSGLFGSKTCVFSTLFCIFRVQFVFILLWLAILLPTLCRAGGVIQITQEDIKITFCDLIPTHQPLTLKLCNVSGQVSAKTWTSADTICFFPHFLLLLTNTPTPSYAPADCSPSPQSQLSYWIFRNALLV